MKRRGNKVMGQARKIMVAPIEKNEIYKATKMEFKNQSKRSKLGTFLAFGCCFYWLTNSVLGLFILAEYPSLNENHPDIYRYILYFSAKWVLATLGTLGVLLIL